MSEKEFRSISPKTGKFVYFKIGELDENYITYGECSFRGEYINPDIIEQYIDVKDKNGKKIYEGDIDKHYGVVIFIAGCFKFNPFMGSNRYTYQEVGKIAELVEIIGNIHETH